MAAVSERRVTMREVPTFGSLFAGIGGLDLGLERAGWRCAWQVEVDDFCRSVLSRHWPEVPKYGDIREVRGEQLQSVDLIAGGFPCQPFSVAGKRGGTADPRWMWPEFSRLIRECRPSFVLVENSPALRKAALRDVLADLAALGFDAEWSHFEAREAGAPHIRNRLFLVAAHPDHAIVREQPGRASGAFGAAGKTVDRSTVEECPVSANPNHQGRLEQSRRLAEKRGWSQYCGWRLGSLTGVDDGLPGRLGAARKALGNAVVPQVAEVVGRAIREST